MTAVLNIPAPRFSAACLVRALAWSPADQEAAGRDLCDGYGGIRNLPQICADWEWIKLAQRLAWHHGAERALAILNRVAR